MLVNLLVTEIMQETTEVCQSTGSVRVAYYCSVGKDGVVYLLKLSFSFLLNDIQLLKKLPF